MEEIIGNKTAPTYNGTGKGTYADPVLQAKAKQIADMAVKASQQKQTVPAAQSGMVSQAVVAGRDKQPNLQAKPTNSMANSALAYQKAKEMQARLAEQSGNKTEAQKARPIVTAILDLIYGGNK